MNYKIKILASFSVLLFISCETNTYSEISSKNEATNPTYITNIKPIIAENCNSCHSVAGGQRPYLEDITQVKDAILNTQLLNLIEAPSGFGMPLNNRMPQSKINTIKLWSNTGFTNQ